MEHESQNISFSRERRTQLLEALSRLEMDDPEAAMTFTDRLAREQLGWSREFAGRVVSEYTRFLVLMALSPRPVTPSESVDQAWHLHIVYTRSYHEWCETLAGRYIHHGPTKGGSAEGIRYESQYDYTMALYEAVFESAPPADIWPAADIRFSPSERAIWARPSAVTHIRRRRLRLVATLALLTGIALGWILVTVTRDALPIFEQTHAQTSPAGNTSDDEEGRKPIMTPVEIVVLVVLIGGVAVAATSFTQSDKARRQKHKGSGGAGGCGGGGIGCGNNDSGCGSGCGGGGGCGGCGG